MPQPEHECKLWSVAGRFHFSDAELEGMTLRRLQFWYRGHEYMVGEERRSIAAMMGKKERPDNGK